MLAVVFVNFVKNADTSVLPLPNFVQKYEYVKSKSKFILDLPSESI